MSFDVRAFIRPFVLLFNFQFALSAPNKGGAILGCALHRPPVVLAAILWLGQLRVMRPLR
jgi:hypothetical protein